MHFYSFSDFGEFNSSNKFIKYELIILSIFSSKIHDNFNNIHQIQQIRLSSIKTCITKYNILYTIYIQLMHCQIYPQMKKLVLIRRYTLSITIKIIRKTRNNMCSIFFHLLLLFSLLLSIEIQIVVYTSAQSVIHGYHLAMCILQAPTISNG